MFARLATVADHEPAGNVLRLFCSDAVCGQEMCVRECNLPLTFCIVGCRGAVEVNGAVQQKRETVRCRYRLKFKFEVSQVTFVLYGIDNLKQMLIM